MSGALYSEETYVGVELNGTMTTGCTVVDLKGYLKKKPNAKVCTDIDGEKSENGLSSQFQDVYNNIKEDGL